LSGLILTCWEAIWAPMP